MTALVALPLLVGLAALPLLALFVDLFPSVRSARWRTGTPEISKPVTDFALLVPIYGAVRYLENISYLSRYRNKVTLCTTGAESPEFYLELNEIASEHGFNVFVASYRPAASRGRQVGGLTRDRVITEALCAVTAEYVVCVDADTETTATIEEMVGTLAMRGLDIASVRLVVSNATNLLTRLQAHEYRMAMRMRRLMPWLCSGACHLGRTQALRHVMQRHSMFFQGNDAEIGLLATAMDLTVGHLDYAVPTAVPDRLLSWWRQRFAWSGGEFRLYVMNLRLGRRHPWFVAYGALLVFALAPLRLLSAIDPGWRLAAVLAIYWMLVLMVNRHHWDRALVLYPVYGLFNSLVMIPLGILSYANMAVHSRNAGIINAGRPPRLYPVPYQL